MATRSEIATVYAAGLIQGIALVTFPAASSVFLNPNDFALSGAQYGAMFIPQALTAIVASLLGALFRNRAGTKHLYLFGLFANLLAMILLFACQFLIHNHSLSFPLLLCSTACMGLGFGFTVPALNTLASAYFPQHVDRAILALNALLGLGTALAPIFVAVFVGLGVWWGLPLSVSLLLMTLLFYSMRSIKSSYHATPHAVNPVKQKTCQKIPKRFWIFAIFIALYGICETMNGNWATLYLSNHFGASTASASVALTLFWAMVTIGRITFAVIEHWVPERIVCRILPLIVAVSFFAIACFPRSSVYYGFFAFALAGFGCSALLPLTISFAQREFTEIAGSVAGGLIAFYQFGYGIAAFGVGPLQTWAGLNLNTIFGATAFVALAMSVLSFIISRKVAVAV